MNMKRNGRWTYWIWGIMVLGNNGHGAYLTQSLLGMGHNGHEAIDIGQFLGIAYGNGLIGMKQYEWDQRALAKWGKMCVRVESVLYRSHFGNAYRHVGNTEVHVNFSHKRQRCIKFPLENVKFHGIYCFFENNRKNNP